MINTKKCDVCLFLHVLLDGLKILWDLKILWEMASRCAKFCEILSQSVRYGMYIIWILKKKIRGF